MSYWLLKTDPDTYSFADLEKEKKTVWDGVSNNLALKYIREMKKGDLALIYHSGNDKAVVGVAEIIRDPYPDPKQKDPKLAVVELKPLRRLAKSVTLAQIKSDPAFKDFLLVKMSRLSVMPVTDRQWEMLTS